MDSLHHLHPKAGMTRIAVTVILERLPLPIYLRRHSQEGTLEEAIKRCRHNMWAPRRLARLSSIRRIKVCRAQRNHTRKSIRVMLTGIH